MHEYTITLTNSYPPDIRIFISKILPILVEEYNFPLDFDEETELNRFDWGNMHHRQEEYILGDEGLPRVKFTRNVLGDLEFSDEWERSLMELIDFAPPFVEDIVSLRVECAESFLLTDKGTHQCSIDFKTSSENLYHKIVKAMDEILAKFPDAGIEMSEKE